MATFLYINKLLLYNTFASLNLYIIVHTLLNSKTTLISFATTNEPGHFRKLRHHELINNLAWWLALYNELSNVIYCTYVNVKSVQRVGNEKYLP